MISHFIIQDFHFDTVVFSDAEGLKLFKCSDYPSLHNIFLRSLSEAFAVIIYYRYIQKKNDQKLYSDGEYQPVRRQAPTCIRKSVPVGYI